MGPFVPANLAEHIFAAVAVDVAEGNPVTAAFGAENERFHREPASIVFGEAKDLEGFLPRVTRGVKLGQGAEPDARQ